MSGKTGSVKNISPPASYPLMLLLSVITLVASQHSE